MKRVLVTGAGGFIGKRLCQLLYDKGYQVRAIYRRNSKDVNDYEKYNVEDLGSDTRWGEILKDVDFIIHLAARVHVMNETEDNPLATFREVNLYGTKNLARQAVKAGVKRFIYVSTIKVNGECTYNRPFRASDVPKPSDPYAISKSEAETELANIADSSNLETVVIRPPLVYGPGVKGNYDRLLKLVSKKIPLPLQSVENERSMVSLDNICDLLINCLENPNAAGKTLLVSDGVDLSTPDLIRKLSHYMKQSDRLFPLPVRLLKIIGGMLGKGAIINRLCESLVVDIKDTREGLGWKPPQTPDEGIRQTVEWYLNKK